MVVRLPGTEKAASRYVSCWRDERLINCLEHGITGVGRAQAVDLMSFPDAVAIVVLVW